MRMGGREGRVGRRGECGGRREGGGTDLHNHDVSLSEEQQPLNHLHLQLSGGGRFKRREKGVRREWNEGREGNRERGGREEKREGSFGRRRGK